MQTEKFNATPEQILEWKKKHGSIYQHTLKGLEDLEGQEFSCITRKPSRDDLGIANTLGGKDYIKTSSIIANKIWLAGDEIIKTDEALYMGYLAKCQELILVSEGETKKL